MIKILWTIGALQDRERIYDYLDEKNPMAAIKIDELIREKVNTLALNHLIGRVGKVVDTRELVIHPHYVIVYDVTDVIRILRVLHTSQKWGAD